MALTAEQEKANRKAAQARKKRGRGAAKKVDNTVQPITLIQMVNKNRQFAENKANREKDIVAAVEGFKARLVQQGSVLIPDDIRNVSDIVARLKGSFRGDKNVVWNHIGGGIVFAKSK